MELQGWIETLKDIWITAEYAAVACAATGGLVLVNLLVRRTNCEAERKRIAAEARRRQAQASLKKKARGVIKEESL